MNFIKSSRLMSEQKYITNDGLMWEGILKTGTKKSPEQIRPIFEAITWMQSL